MERQGGARGAGELYSVSAMACKSARDIESKGAKDESEPDRVRRSGWGSPYQQAWVRWQSCEQRGHHMALNPYA